MKQIVVISGKGGTGKTVITGALAALAENKVMADCDVDAADLHLLLKPEIRERHEFRSGFTAIIDNEKCTECGRCRELCRYDAITRDFKIDSESCEGCALCSFACPAGAIKMEENLSGELFISDTRFGPLVHAKLGAAQENSGKLVALVRKRGTEIAESKKCDWVIVDGAPGIGCPVIASLSGIDCAIVVTEPTLSGMHDADRVIQVAKHFGVPAKVVVNKYDLNIEMTSEIEKYCDKNKIQVLGKIEFDESVIKAMVQGKTIMEYGNGKMKDRMISLWDKIVKMC